MGNEETRTEELRSDYESVTSDALPLTDPADGENQSENAVEDENNDTGDTATPGTSESEDVDTGKKSDDEGNEPENKDESTQDDDKKKPGRFQKKINSLTRQKYELERENADLKEKLKKPSDAPPKTEEKKKPAPGDFENYEDFQEALMDWKLEQKEIRETKKKAEEKEENDLKETEKVFYDRLAKYGDEHEDFIELVLDNEDLKITPDIFQAVMDSEHAPEILHHLGKNPEETARIAGLSPIAVIREIGRIEANFIKEGKPPDPPPKKTTNAPDPITPIAGSKKGEKKPEDMSNKEYRQWREGKKG